MADKLHELIAAAEKAAKAAYEAEIDVNKAFAAKAQSMRRGRPESMMSPQEKVDYNTLLKLAETWRGRMYFIKKGQRP